MENIEFYFNKYLSDKAVNGYAPVYDELLSPCRNDEITLLEIGIGTLNPTESNMQFWKNKPEYQEYLPGASLKAFRDYFPNGKIYGVDIQPDCVVIEERIQTFLFDSTDPLMCENYFHTIRLDVIVDDGDHHPGPQIATFKNFFPKLNDGGVYILEDLAFPDEIKRFFEDTTYNYEFRNGLVFIKK